MQDEFPTVEALIDSIKGTTSFLSGLITLKFGVLIALLAFVLLFSKVIFG